MIDPKFICPSISEKVYLEIQTYVTQELEPPLVGLDFPLLDVVFHFLQNNINLSLSEKQCIVALATVTGKKG